MVDWWFDEGSSGLVILIWRYVWGWLVVRKGFIEVNCFGVHELIGSLLVVVKGSLGLFTLICNYVKANLGFVG